MLTLIGQGKRVLDIGCFDGTIAELVQRNNKVVGIDIAPKAVALARKNGVNAHVFNFEEDLLPTSFGKFDLVIAGEIIEHVFDTGGFIRKISRILVPNGELVLTTPNLVGLGSRLGFMFGKTPWMIENGIEGIKSGHIRYFTKETLTELLHTNGFKVEVLTCDSLGLGREMNIPFFDELLPQFGHVLIVRARKV